MTNRIYPDHLYDPTRRQIGRDILQKELNKQLVQSGNAAIDASAWMEQFDDHTYWNAIEGFMGGTLIKPIVHFVTAKNYTWSKRDLAPRDIQLASKLSQLDRLDDLRPDQLFLSDIDDRLRADPTERQYQLDAVQSHSRGKEQDNYPIITVEKQHGPMVMDGNRRSLHALLLGHTSITAWHCATGGQPPRDFWYPIDDMLRLTQQARMPAAAPHVQGVLRAIFDQSDVARIAYKQRIVNVGTPGAAEIYAAICE